MKLSGIFCIYEDQTKTSRDILNTLMQQSRSNYSNVRQPHPAHPFLFT